MAASSEIPNLSPKPGRGSREFAAALSRHSEAAEHSEFMPATPVTFDAPALTVRTGEASLDAEAKQNGADALSLLASHPVRRLAALATRALCWSTACAATGTGYAIAAGGCAPLRTAVVQVILDSSNPSSLASSPRSEAALQMAPDRALQASTAQASALTPCITLHRQQCCRCL